MFSIVYNNEGSSYNCRRREGEGLVIIDTLWIRRNGGGDDEGDWSSVFTRGCVKEMVEYIDGKLRDLVSNTESVIVRGRDVVAYSITVTDGHGMDSRTKSVMFGPIQHGWCREGLDVESYFPGLLDIIEIMEVKRVLVKRIRPHGNGWSLWDVSGTW